MIIFLAGFFFINTLFLNSAGAEERGYEEAKEYFIFREKSKQAKESQDLEKLSSFTDSLNNIILYSSKYLISFGVGEFFGSRHYSVELGASFVQSRRFQQSLYFEYIQFNTRSLGEDKFKNIKRAYGQGLFLFHSVQLSSQFFYFSPEISAGMGHIFNSSKKGSLLALKTGVVYSNKWSQRRLFSARLYYRRNEYFKTDYHGDGVGFSLRFEF